MDESKAGQMSRVDQQPANLNQQQTVNQLQQNQNDLSVYGDNDPQLAQNQDTLSQSMIKASGNEGRYDIDAVQQYYQNQPIEQGKAKQQQPPGSRKGIRNQHNQHQIQRAKNIQENSPYAQQFQSIPSQSKQSSSIGFSKEGGSEQKSNKNDRRSSSKSSQPMDDALAASGSQSIIKIGYSQIQQQKDDQGGTPIMLSEKQQQFISESNRPSNLNEGRRVATAPEGASRGDKNGNLNLTNNPYGMISGQAVPANVTTAIANSGPSTAQNQHMNILKMSTSSNEKARNLQGHSHQVTNQSTGAISGSGGSHSHQTPQTSQQNQMIAKIYGRSNKFVINHHTGANANSNDQYKKPKMSHMKEIVKQKAQQQRMEVKPLKASVIATNAQTGNTDNGPSVSESQVIGPAVNTSQMQQNVLKKIKVDNARLKSFQASQGAGKGPQKFVDKKPNNRMLVAGSQKLNKTTILQGEMNRNSQLLNRTYVQQSKTNVQDMNEDNKKNMILTAPQSDMRNHLSEVKSSIKRMREGSSQDPQIKKSLPEEIALTKSVDSHRFQGRQSQASRASRNSQQIRQSDLKIAATPQQRELNDSRNGINASMNENWQQQLNHSMTEANTNEVPNSQNISQFHQNRPTGPGQGGRKQKFAPKKSNQPIKGQHLVNQPSDFDKKKASELNTSGNNINNSFALSQRQEEVAQQDAKKIDSAFKKHVKPQNKSDKNTVVEAVNSSKTQIQQDLSRVLNENEERKDKQSNVNISQFNRGLEDGSFHPVDETQFQNQKEIHGFTMPPQDETGSGGSAGAGYIPEEQITGEGSHVLYADVHNVQFSQHGSRDENAMRKEKDEFQTNLESTTDMQKLKEDRSAKRGRQATKNFNKVNDVSVKGIGEKSQTPIPTTNHDEVDKESDLENLTKLFKPESNLTSNNGSGDHQGQSDFIAARQQYSDMKRLQTSQGPRTQKYLGQSQKNHQSQPQPVTKKSEAIDENSDEDLKSENYQNEADVESQNTEEGEAYVPAITSHNSRRKKGKDKSKTRDGQVNMLQRPPQTAPSSQMVQIQQQNQGIPGGMNSSSINRQNHKLLKIKGKLSSQFHHTQTIPQPGLQPQDEFVENGEISRSMIGVNEGGEAIGQTPSALEEMQKQASKNGTELQQQQFQNEQNNSQIRMNSGSNSQQQFSRTIDPTMGNNPMGIMHTNGSTEGGAPPADDKPNQNIVSQPLTNIDPTGLQTKTFDNTTNCEINFLQTNVSRNSQASKTQQIDKNRREFFGSEGDQNKQPVPENNGSAPIKQMLTQPVSPQTNLRIQPNQSQNQTFSLTNMHHPQPGQPLPLQQVTNEISQPGQLKDISAGPVANMLGYQFEQWQRPPSRQKEPNQALGLDDARPKTRGNNQTNSFGQTTMLGYHFSGISGRGEEQPRQRKRNIQQFIPQNSQGNNVVYQGPAGNSSNSGMRPRGMIDFWHQRNHNFNGFNSQDEQVRQNSFHKQYQFQPRTDQTNQDEQRPETSGGPKKMNPRRNPGQRGYSGPAQSGSMQRPPSRHKDPSQNLGLDIYPPGMGFASPDEFDPPVAGLTPHYYGAQKASINGMHSFFGFDQDHDIDGQAFESDIGADDRIDIAGHILGPMKGVAPPKQFKEDEDDFFEQQYKQNKGDKKETSGINKEKSDVELPKKPEKLKIRTNKRGKFARLQSDGMANSFVNQQYQSGHHQRNMAGTYGQNVSGYQANTSHNSLNQQVNQGFPHHNYTQTYGHGMSIGPLLPGTAPSPGQGSKLFPYHPGALQQTQNFYIGMNQILPQNPSDAAQAAIVQDFFNMSANVQNMLKNPPKTSHQAKRMLSTSQGPGMGHSSQTVTAFHSTGFQNRGDMRQAAESTQKGLENFNNPLFIEQYNQDSLQRQFANQRSPVNERSGAIQQLLMQNANLKQINKPKSATGHRISGKQNRFKNLNNSGRFVGQNSTIIHSAYNNQAHVAGGPHGSNPLMPQQMKMYQHPKTGGWIDSSTQPSQVSGSKPGHVIGNSQDAGAQSGANSELPNAQMFAKSQLPISMIKQAQSTPAANSKANDKRQRAQFFPRGDSMAESNKQHNTSGFMAQRSQLQHDHSHTDSAQERIKTGQSAQERIKTGQEHNNNRPKESQGYRSTGKRQNNQSLGVNAISLPQGANAHPMPIPPAHIKRIQMPKTGNFVSSPIAGGAGQREGSQNLIGGYQVTSLGGTQNLKKGKQNVAELFSQTSKISRGVGKRGTTNEGLQQSSMQANDKHLDLLDDSNLQGTNQLHNTANLPFSTNNQNSFKSQTLQFPNSSQLGAEFINLFAD